MGIEIKATQVESKQVNVVVDPFQILIALYRYFDVPVWCTEKDNKLYIDKEFKSVTHSWLEESLFSDDQRKVEAFKMICQIKKEIENKEGRSFYAYAISQAVTT